MDRNLEDRIGLHLNHQRELIGRSDRKRLHRQIYAVLNRRSHGAGKTTFARRYLPENAGVVHFVNADLIASGMSPLKPEIAAIAAARMVLGELDRLVADRADFAFETTLSGLTYVHRLKSWKRAGYRIDIVYLKLSSSRLALRRVAAQSASRRPQCSAG